MPLAVAIIVLPVWLIFGYKVGTVLLLIAMTALFIFLYRAMHETKKNRTRLIRSHAAELERKRRQLSFIDSYGRLNESKWHKEVRYFIEHVLEVPRCKANKAETERLAMEIGQAVNAFAAIRVRSDSYSTEMSGVEYERYCAEELRRLGFNAVNTKSTGDQGADIIASMDSKRIIVQCKHYSSNVSNAAVQEAISAREYYDATHAAVVSNADFTTSAKQLARKAGVFLLHHEELAGLGGLLRGNQAR